jgi:ribonuclease PH
MHMPELEQTKSIGRMSRSFVFGDPAGVSLKPHWSSHAEGSAKWSLGLFSYVCVASHWMDVVVVCIADGWQTGEASCK